MATANGCGRSKTPAILDELEGHLREEIREAAET